MVSRLQFAPVLLSAVEVACGADVVNVVLVVNIVGFHMTDMNVIVYHRLVDIATSLVVAGIVVVDVYAVAADVVNSIHVADKEVPYKLVLNHCLTRHGLLGEQ